MRLDANANVFLPRRGAKFHTVTFVKVEAALGREGDLAVLRTLRAAIEAPGGGRASYAGLGWGQRVGFDPPRQRLEWDRAGAVSIQRRLRPTARGWLARAGAARL